MSHVLTPALTPSTLLTPGPGLFPASEVRSGGRITPHRIAMGIGVGGAMVDVTDWVAFEEGVRRTSGRSDQFRDVAPGTVTFTLNNHDGRFTPGNAASPLATTITEGMPVCWQLGGRLVRTTVLAAEIPANEAAWDQLVVTCDDMLGDAARRDLTTLPDGLTERVGNLLMWRLDEDEEDVAGQEVHGDGLGPFVLHSSNPASTTDAVTFGRPSAAGLPGTALKLSAAPGETNWFGTAFGRTDVVTRVQYPQPPTLGGRSTWTGFYDLTGVEPDEGIRLDMARTSVLQAAVKSPETGHWYSTQATSGSNGSTEPYSNTTISRQDARGQLLDSMICVDAGRGNGIGLEYTSDGMYVWMSWAKAATGGTDYDIVRFKYTPGTFARTAATGLTRVFTAAQLSSTSARTDVIFDTAYGWVMACEQISGSHKRYRRYDLANFRQGILTQSGATLNHQDVEWTLQGWQGVGDAAFIYSGASNGGTADPPAVREYRWTDGTLVQRLDLTGMGADPDGSYPGDRYEPESFTVYQPTPASPPVAYLGLVRGASGQYTYTLFTFTLRPQIASGSGGATPAVTQYVYGYWSMWVYPGSTINLAVTPKFATGGGYSNSFQIQCTPTTVGVKAGTNTAAVYRWTADQTTSPHFVSMRPNLVWQAADGGYWALFVNLFVDGRMVATTYWADGRYGYNVGGLSSDEISPVMVNVSVTNPSTASGTLSGTVARISHQRSGTGSEHQALYASLDQRRAVLDTITREISSATYAPAGPLWDTVIGFPDVAGRSVLDVYNDIVRTEQGHMFTTTRGTLTAPVEQIQIRARDRPETPRAVFDAVLELEGPPTFARDVTNVAASVEVTGPAGKTTVTDPTVAQLTSRFIAATGGETILSTDVDDLRLWGQDRLTRGRNVGIVARAFTVDAMTTGVDRAADLLGLVPGDRVRVTGLPQQRLGFTAWDGWLLGVDEHHTPDGHRFTLMVQPVLDAPDVYDDPVFAADGDVTLTAAVTAAAAAMTVQSATATAMSTTVPYTLRVEAENVRVTAVTGSTLTVTRGYGGTAAAAHPAGAAVDVADAALFAF